MIYYTLSCCNFFASHPVRHLGFAWDTAVVHVGIDPRVGVHTRGQAAKLSSLMNENYRVLLRGERCGLHKDAYYSPIDVLLRRILRIFTRGTNHLPSQVTRSTSGQI